VRRASIEYRERKQGESTAQVLSTVTYSPIRDRKQHRQLDASSRDSIGANFGQQLNDGKRPARRIDVLAHLAEFARIRTSPAATGSAGAVPKTVFFGAIENGLS
jgi:hypothetical protein